MDFFADIQGNERIVSLLRREAERGTLSHAYIIEGAPGSGRSALARAALCTLAGEPDAERIARRICPDIIDIRPPEGKVQIVVDQIRAIKEEAYLSPNELSFKAFLIEEAHRMNEAAQNALLKLLEEPPAGVYFFLICETGTRLLPTVSSRAQTLRTDALPAEAPDAALYTAVTGLLDLLRGTDKGALLLYESKIPDVRESFGAFLHALSAALRDILVFKKGGAEFLFFSRGSTVEEYGFAFSEKDLANMLRVCLRHTEQNEFSVNLRVARLRLLDGLWG